MSHRSGGNWTHAVRIALVLCMSLGARREAGARSIGPDAFGYRATDAVPVAFEDIASTGVLMLAGTDDGVASASMGFTFNFYGRDFTSVSWNTNGLMTFGGTSSQFGNLNIETQRLIGDRPSIAVLWDDWQFAAGVSQGTHHETRGTAPRRRFILQWTRAVGFDTLAETITYQVILFEGTNTVLMQYLDVNSGDARAFGAQATIGLRDTNGQVTRRNLQWSFNQAVLADGQAIRFGNTTDSTPPMVTVTSPADGAIVGTFDVFLGASIADDSAVTVSSTPPGVSASLPAGGGAASGTVAVAEGPNTLTVTAVDEARNTGGAAVTVIRDTIAPSMSSISPASGTVFGASPVTFTVDVFDRTATTVRFGMHSFSIPAGGGSVSGDVALAEGFNGIAVSAMDAAGNTTAVQVDIILDLSAPLVTIDTPAAGSYFGPGSSPVAVTATVDDLTATEVSSLPAGVSASLPAGGGIASGAVALSEGMNEIAVSAMDATGRNASAAVVVFLDTTPPMVAIDAPAPGAVHGEIDFAASASDSGSGLSQVDLLVDGALLASFAAPPFEAAVDTMTLADGTHVLMAMAFDGTGNSASTMVQVMVDHTPPVVSFEVPADGEVVRGMAAFRALAADGGSGLVFLEVRANGMPTTTSPALSFDPPVASEAMSGEEDTSRWADGPLGFTVMGVDAAGNETVATLHVVVDNVVTATIVLSPAEGSVVSGRVPITVEFSGPAIDSMEVFVDEVPRGSSSRSPFTVHFDTTTRLDGEMEIEAVVKDVHGNTMTASAHVTVDNMSFRFSPMVINVNSKRRDMVTAHVSGPNVKLLLPLRRHGVELRVPGGSPVRAALVVRSRQRGSVEKLKIKFSRRQLLSSIRAGMAAGMISADSTMPLTLVADGKVLGVAFPMVRAKGQWSRSWNWGRSGGHDDDDDDDDREED